MRGLNDKPGCLGAAVDNGRVLKATRDEAEEDEELRPSAKFNNGITTWTTRSHHSVTSTDINSKQNK